jgi:hypothetical protein
MTTVHVVNGPTDMDPDELAERKRLAAIEYYTRELDVLEASLDRLEAKDAPAAKVEETRRMIAECDAALAALEGA